MDASSAAGAQPCPARPRCVVVFPFLDARAAAALARGAEGSGWDGVFVVGLVVGLAAGYPVGAAAGMVLVAPLIAPGRLATETGGWTETNVAGGILWLATAGGTVGLCQQWPLRRRWGRGWAVGSAVVWGLIAFASLGGECRLRAVDLGIAVPRAALCSAAGGAAISARRGARRLSGSVPLVEALGDGYVGHVRERERVLLY